MNQLFSIFAPDKSGTLFSDQNGKVFNDYIHAKIFSNMKRKMTLMIAAFAVAALSFTACGHEGGNEEEEGGGGNIGLIEGVYQPSKKISRIVSTVQGSSVSNTGGVWNWQNNNLKSISSYLNGDLVETEIFTYQNNRIVRIDFTNHNNGHVECQYDGNKIKKANTYIDGQLSATYTYTYTNGYVTRIDASYFNINHSADPKYYYGLPDIPGVDLTKIIGDAIPKHQIKTSGSSTFNLTWNNGNITRLEATNDVYVFSRYIVELEYDTYDNPLHGWFWASLAYSGIVEGASGGEGIGGMNSFSKNNVIRCTLTVPDEEYVIQETVSRTYEGTYPKTATITASTSGVEVVNVVEYEYLN